MNGPSSLAKEDSAGALAQFPRTRYQGSKRRIAHEILHEVGFLSFHTVLDAFGGTGAVSHAFKRMGKAVTYNDVLEFNRQIGVALIENESTRLDESVIRDIGIRSPTETYGDFIESTFDGVYFTNAENQWLDVAAANIRRIACRIARALAWFALFQSALAKRPYNLFHRRNLYMRTACVARGFGNKASWDRPFEKHFVAFAAEANDAVFRSGVSCVAQRGDAIGIVGEFDLVYIDPPYLNPTGTGTPYRDWYHFLEGIVDLPQWPAMIDRKSKHLRLSPTADPWCNPMTIESCFARIFDRFRRSHLVVSYRSDGIPPIAKLVKMLQGVKKHVQTAELRRGPYVLSLRRSTSDMLLIAYD